MLYHYYDSYGYVEENKFRSTAEQKGFNYPQPKNVNETVMDDDSFYTENGQQLTDLVAPQF